ncbi:MAG: beta-lactamase family protein [Victivallales bacterium]|nr:beta-lactamase family protein [Victivallales bacterium]
MRKDWDNLRDSLQRILDDGVERGEECGCQLAIYDGGRLVVDLAAGYYTPERERKVTTDSLFPIFSCGKPVVATAMHRLVMRGLIGYDTRIGDVWPEFDCNNKHGIQLWNFMTHTAGLYRNPVPDDSDEMAAWEYMCTILAKSAPLTPPGTRTQYHGLTFAWLMGETIARVAHKPFAEVMHDEIFHPLGIEDEFFFGTDSAADSRFVPADSSAFADGKEWCSDFINNPVIRHAVIPSANGVATARALARHYAALIGEVDGVRLLSDSIVANATVHRDVPDDPPLAQLEWMKFGLGYALAGPLDNISYMFGQGGASGGEGLAIKSEGVAIAFTKNHTLTTPAVVPVRDRISQLLEIPVRHW